MNGGGSAEAARKYWFIYEREGGRERLKYAFSNSAE